MPATDKSRDFHVHRYVWLVVVLLLIALECIPFWMFQYFPSQDGPAHLYNAAVVADYGKEAVYRDYYFIHFPLSGNVVTPLLLVGLLKIGVAPLIAEKLLLTTYAALLPLCLRYLLGNVSSYANSFSLFAVILIPNFPLHMGFWNFCLGIPLALFAVGYYLSRGNVWSLRSIVIFGVLGALVYLTHIVAWGMFAIAVITLEFTTRISAAISLKTTVLARWRDIIPLRPALALATLLPPGVFTVVSAVILRRSGHQALENIPKPLRERAWSVYSLSFLQTLSPSDFVVAKVVAALLGLMLVVTLIFRARRARFLRRTDLFMFLSGVCAFLAVFGPEFVGDGGYIPMRLALFWWVFLIIWFAAQEWSKWMIGAYWVVLPTLAVVSLLARLPDYRQWDSVLKETRNIAEQIRPGATVLSLNTKGTHEFIAPLAHATDLFVPRPFIDLRNYEGNSDLFLTCFRHDHSPFDALGKLVEMNRVPAIFDIVRYEKETKGRVDYVFLYTSPKFVSGGGQGDQNYQDQLSSYQLIYTTEVPFEARLYARKQR